MSDEKELTLEMLEPGEGNPAPELDEESVSVDRSSENETLNSDEPQPGDEQGQKLPDEKTPYSPEEITALLNDGDLTKIDSSRLSPEGQLVMKSFQRGLTPKLEAAAEERRRIEQERQALEHERQQLNDPKEKIYRDYLADPMKVTQQINLEIKKLARISPQSEDFAEAQAAIIDMQNFKEELSTRRQNELEQYRNQDLVKEKVALAIRRDIPDFDNGKEKALTEFAMGMGFSLPEIQYLTMPEKVGTLAFKITKVLNDMYTKANAGKTANKKEKKATPTPLARGGSSQETPSVEKDPKDMSMPEYMAWAKKKRGGTI